MGRLEKPGVAASAERQARPDVVRETHRVILADTPKYAGAHFAALRRILDREGPEYAN
jgi:hypothetical protein